MSEAVVTGVIVRPMVESDIPSLCLVLNEIIAKGGTTAIEDQLDAPTFRHWFLDGEFVVSSVAAEVDGVLAGFQTLSCYGELPAGWGDIGTFVRQPGGRGVGSALFAATRTAATARGLVAITATIRADNTGGLAFYSRCGFVDYQRDAAVPLKDGTPVDRISKVLHLAGAGVDKVPPVA